MRYRCRGTVKPLNTDRMIMSEYNTNSATLYIVGLGPGNADAITPQAAEALQQARCIAGYGMYIDLVPTAWIDGKEIISTGMRKEQERCRAAIQAVMDGKTTALVCSGDAGVYGMAGLVLEILDTENLLDTVNVETVPGIPAVCAAAAALGAPLMHDFCCISLSDLLTPWETIVKRLHAAWSADFVVALYNPRSRGRDSQLAQAIEIAKKYMPADTPVGLAQKIGRDGEHTEVCRLAEFNPEKADMLSLIIVGNRSTKSVGSRMLTPRGYRVMRTQA